VRTVCAASIATISIGLALVVSPLAQTRPAGLVSRDLSSLQSVGDVQLSPDGRFVAYTIIKSDRPGRPYPELWAMELGSRKATRVGGSQTLGSDPHWSPDGRSIAFFGRSGEDAGLLVATPDGSPAALMTRVEGTNHPLPSSGEALAWSPDGNRIAFISSAPGPEQDANGDPMVITRYLYKPTASEGMTRFNDNRRLHIFVVDRNTKTVKPLTSGNAYEHSIDWSPKGDEILFVSNREADADRVFNYDIFALKVADGAVRRLCDTKSAEYEPVWSPDGASIAYLGTKRSLTSSETTMEDTHVWTMNADGSNRRELGADIDNRQSGVRWAADRSALYFQVQDHGSVHLYRVPAGGGRAQPVITDAGTVGTWSSSSDGKIAYTLSTPGGPAELMLMDGGRQDQLTTLNRSLLEGKSIAPVEAFTFKSFDGLEAEAFLTKPVDATDGSKHPLIVMMHGGPHGQQGPAFSAKAQVYAARGWGALMVNYRGSTGY
jgi:dipeptidyl aminopeptidase/acylaminoacyl peptidase